MNTAWQVLIQAGAMLYALDSFLELSFVELNERKRKRDKLNRTTLSIQPLDIQIHD
jgi:hypothetical protein